MTAMQNRFSRWGCASARARAFTLIEILIVVVILGILAAIVIPNFSGATATARNSVLKDDLRYLRTQVIVFKAQHRDIPPGYANGDFTAAPTFADFFAQMTGYTDEFSRVGAASDVFRFGPYLSKMPPNPINGLDTMIIVANGAPMPAPDGSTGWIYKAQTQEILPNLTGTDENGMRYTEY